MPIRQPIVCVLGHVDSGKTLLLDRIRKTSVGAREVGGITQHIGASFFPVETLKQLVGPGLAQMKSGIEIPGILVIDTPGHEAFTNLRRRGGSVADIAILVIDVLRGFEAQTYECIDILKARRTPFIVAVNKIDRVPGWKSQSDASFLKVYPKQDSYVKEDLDNKLYEIMGTFSRLKLNTDRFDRVRDFTSTVALVPVSAKTGEGIPELLMVLIGLTQQFLKKQLQTTEGAAKGSVLEIKEEPGLGLTLNAIIYDGTLYKDDLIVLGGKEKPIVTRIRAILVPKPLDEMRDPRDKFKPVDYVEAAAGIKIASPDLEGVLPGSTVYVTNNESKLDEFKQIIESEMKSVFIDTQTNGIILKCDTIGSLEALTEMLRRQQVPVAKADIGPVNRRDVLEAKVIKDNDRHLGVILAFNVRILPDAQEESELSHVKIFSDKIIYSLLDNYVQWVDEDTANEENAIFNELTPICKFTFLKGYVFRNSNPAVFGIRVDVGKVRQKIPIMNKSGKKIGMIHQLQDGKKSIESASHGQEVACSIQDVMIGRHIFEEDVFYSLPRSSEAKQLIEKFTHKLSSEEQAVLNEIVEIQRKIDSSYGYI